MSNVKDKSSNNKQKKTSYKKSFNQKPKPKRDQTFWDEFHIASDIFFNECLIDQDTADNIQVRVKHELSYTGHNIWFNIGQSPDKDDIDIGKETNNKVLSKRQINTPGSLALMSGATIFNTWILINYPQHFYREMGMFLSMVYISGIWTVVSYYKDFRRVEVQLYQHRCNIGREYVRKLDTFLDAFFILGYDVVFEIGMAYITFYNIVLMLHSQVMTTIQNIPIYK